MRTDFNSYRAQLFALYNKGKYPEALNIARAAHDKFPENRGTTYFWLMCLLALLGKKHDALSALGEAIEQGYWWSPSLLERETDLDSIRNEPSFQEMVHRCEALRIQAIKSAGPECQLYWPPGMLLKDTAGLFIALHPYNSTAACFAEIIKEDVLSSRYALLTPQSSQPLSADGYCWDDLEIAKKEVVEHCRQAQLIYSCGPERVILCGHSQGARVALAVGLDEEAGNVTGIFLLMPAARADQFLPLLATPKASKIPCYIVVGSNDCHFKEMRLLADEAGRRSLPWRLDIIPDWGHALPERLSEYIRSALSFFNAAI